MNYTSKRFSQLLRSLLVILSHFALAQNGYFENFNSGTIVPANFSGGVPYLLTIENQTLKTVIAKGDMWSGVYVSMPSPLNLSATTRRKVSFKIRTDTTTRQLPFEIGVFLFSSPGQDGGRRANKMIYPTSKWQTITFDFNDPGFTTVNYNAVTAFQIVAQPQNYMERGTIYIDDVAVGDNGVADQAAVSAPYFLGFENQDTYVNSPAKTVKILNAVDADNLNSQISFSAVSSNKTLLPNLSEILETVSTNCIYYRLKYLYS